MLGRCCPVYPVVLRIPLSSPNIVNAGLMHTRRAQTVDEVFQGWSTLVAPGMLGRCCPVYPVVLRIPLSFPNIVNAGLMHTRRAQTVDEVFQGWSTRIYRSLLAFGPGGERNPTPSRTKRLPPHGLPASI